MSFITIRIAKDRKIVMKVGSRPRVRVMLLTTSVRFSMYKLKAKLMEKLRIILTITHSSFAFLLAV